MKNFKLGRDSNRITTLWLTRLYLSSKSPREHFEDSLLKLFCQRSDVVQSVIIKIQEEEAIFQEAKARYDEAQAEFKQAKKRGENPPDPGLIAPKLPNMVHSSI